MLLVECITGFLIVTQIAMANQTTDPNSVDNGIQITILYDNYTLTEGCTPDWGFACIIKGTEKCILFDTGANGEILLENMDKLQVPAGDVELVVISHDHYDHTGGLSSFLGRNSNVTAYLPLTVSASLIQIAQSLGATVVLPDDPVQICEAVHLVRMRISNLDEQFMIIETPQGMVVITGCAHPGIVQIIQKAKQLFRKDIYFVFGGFHLGGNSDSQIISMIRQIQSLGVQKVGPSHCTGDRAIELFKQEFGSDFVPMGIGPVTIPNRCDFNDDGNVDIDDLVMLIEHWQTDEPLFDIAPGLFGDGIVDIKDLEVFMESYEL
jgi:7,8-dihydropterin-6-yl-methyl-4-(beta-D-ribofuranosyl)aminobenzene 5'-phosphate synthase